MQVLLAFFILFRWVAFVFIPFFISPTSFSYPSTLSQK